MITEILLHTIEYGWLDGVEREINDIDEDYIKSSIHNGFHSGELIHYEDHYEEVKGWWKIV